MRKTVLPLLFFIITFSAISLNSCNTVDDDRIPLMPVSIVFSDAGMWNVYGVSGFGISRKFILTSTLREPSSFPYSQTSRTGYGGVLLISGMDPFTNLTDTPLAYDLSCPVERDPDIRVFIDEDNFNAVCPVCGSSYDVTMGAGAPLSGPAATGKYKYGLRRYSVLVATNGGYVITN